MINIKAKIRLSLFRNIWRFRKLSNPLIQFSYFLKNSSWFHKYDVPLFNDDRVTFYGFIIEDQKLKIDEFLYLEFGVSKGDSFKYWINNCTNEKTCFIGFDTFMGIPGDWGNVKAGAYSAFGKVPDITDKRANFEVGLFENTLPSFLNRTNLEKRLVIHLDADLYSSTLFVLVNLSPFLKKDDVIIFDEFFSVIRLTMNLELLKII